MSFFLSLHFASLSIPLVDLPKSFLGYHPLNISEYESFYSGCIQGGKSKHLYTAHVHLLNILTDVLFGSDPHEDLAAHLETHCKNVKADYKTVNVANPETATALDHERQRLRDLLFKNIVPLIVRKSPDLEKYLERIRSAAEHCHEIVCCFPSCQIQTDVSHLQPPSHIHAILAYAIALEWALEKTFSTADGSNTTQSAEEYVLRLLRLLEAHQPTALTAVCLSNLFQPARLLRHKLYRMATKKLSII